jgi:hypothetical protein
MWIKLINTANQGNIVVHIILNPASGPGTDPTIDPNYINASKSGPLVDFINAGGVVYGYVPTNYAQRDINLVKADVDKYYTPSYYQSAFGLTTIPIRGIFFDETSNNLANVGYYQTLRDYVKSKNYNAKVISNPGLSSVTGTSSTFTLDDYVQTADTMVVFENTGQVYLNNYQAPSWVDQYPKSRFAHLIHTQTTLPDDIVELAACTRGAGMLYVTQDVLNNPFDEIPTYWQDLVNDIDTTTCEIVTCCRAPKECFSGRNTIHVLGKGTVPMESLQIGDYVLSRNQKTKHIEYSRVYSFSHYDPDLLVDYIQIFYTMENTQEQQQQQPSPLEISPDHLLYKYNRNNNNDDDDGSVATATTTKIVRASQIQVGDTLVGGSWDQEDNWIMVVSQIQRIQRRGAYAPVTWNGNLFVSHVSASSYVAMLTTEDASIPNWMQHDAAHMGMSWVRWICHYNFDRYCKQETYKEGISTWIWPMVQWVNRLETDCQHWLQRVCAAVVVPALVLGHFFEPITILLLVTVSVVGVVFRNSFASLGKY